MRNTAKKLQGFTLMEMLIVLSIVIILSAVGISGFNSINETFTANENAELVKQDIESARLKAMNMGKESEETWVYGFGIDFRNADSGNRQNGNYRMYKWCSPVKNFGDTHILEGTSYDLTRAKLPNLYSGVGIGENVANVKLCGTSEIYKNGSIPASCGSSGYLEGCLENTTNLSAVFGEDLSLLNRFDGQVVLLNLKEDNNPPSFVLFESLTGKAIIYGRDGQVLNYDEDGTFNADDFVPLDIILRRKSGDTFDMISVYPLSGEIIHHVYGPKDIKENPSECEGNLSCFTFSGNKYERYGIDDEIKSYRD
ncbi:MAG: type II secretion system protein [Candidatus Methanofastidiosum sp.]|nr:type II secretion system protein [Methanofastidiosum sp.]